MILRASFFLSNPSFAQETLVLLGTWLRACLPSCAGELYVLRNDDDDEPLSCRGSLVEPVQAKALIRGGIGGCLLINAQRDVLVHVRSSKTTLPLEANLCSIEVERMVEGKPASEWLAQAFEAATRTLPLRYASGYAAEERAHKNIIDDASGYRAVGVDFSQALPGLYWLNFFGERFVESMSEPQLLSVPAEKVVATAGGVLVQLYAEPEAWSTPEGVARCLAAEQHIGSRFFFSKNDPNRQTTAPDFWTKR